MTPKDRAFEIVDQIYESRLTLAQAALSLASFERTLALARAMAEAAIIEAAGGSKNLGSNEADRSRALTISIEGDEGYAKALAGRNAAELTKLTVQANLESLQNELKVILAFARESQPTAEAQVFTKTYEQRLAELSDDEPLF